MTVDCRTRVWCYAGEPTMADEDIVILVHHLRDALACTFTRSFPNRKRLVCGCRHNKPVTTIDKLGNCVEAAWASIHVHAMQSLFDSMPRLVRAVITAIGNYSGYCFLRIYAP
ncbi:hypothetical protein TNCV_723151 [Trichonephila clavipes]|nr:hypothetical protein TNCV_723151 [Trichonephila clavipes]